MVFTIASILVRTPSRAQASATYCSTVRLEIPSSAPISNVVLPPATSLRQATWRGLNVGVESLPTVAQPVFTEGIGKQTSGNINSSSEVIESTNSPQRNAANCDAG